MKQRFLITVCYAAFGLWSLIGATLVGDEVVLKNSDVLQGTIRRQTSYELVIDHNNLGRLYIPMTEIETAKKAADPNAPVGFLERARRNGWSFTYDLSLDSSTGNTDEQSLRTALGLGREMDRMSFKLKSSFYHKEKNSKTTDNKFYTGYEHRFFNKDSRHYYFGTAMYDNDDFKSWQQRLAGYGGRGYHWVKTKKIGLETSGGLGARREWGSINDAPKFEGLVALGFSWNISQGQDISTNYFYAPVLTNFHDYRVRGSLNWRLVLSQEINISLLLGMLHEYQSIVNPGDKEEDFRFHTGLQLKL